MVFTQACTPPNQSTTPPPAEAVYFRYSGMTLCDPTVTT